MMARTIASEDASKSKSADRRPGGRFEREYKGWTLATGFVEDERSRRRSYGRAERSDAAAAAKLWSGS
jgi:hypothetical protein